MKKLVILFSLLAFSFTGCENKPNPVIYYAGQKVKVLGQNGIVARDVRESHGSWGIWVNYVDNLGVIHGHSFRLEKFKTI